MKENGKQKLLSEAFRLLGAIPVRGDQVDVMAAVRGKLRAVYKMCGEEVPEDGG